MSQPHLLEGHSELVITVAFDKAARTIRFDNGIGHVSHRCDRHLERSRSPARASFFRSAVWRPSEDAQLIGQFWRWFLFKLHRGRSRDSCLAARRAGFFSPHSMGKRPGVVNFDRACRNAPESAPPSHCLCAKVKTSFWRRGSYGRVAYPLLDHFAADSQCAKEVGDKDKSEIAARRELETDQSGKCIVGRAKADIPTRAVTRVTSTFRRFSDPLAWDA